MMRAIVTSSLNFRFLVVVLAAAVMFFGIAQLRKMPVDVLPEFAPPFVEIQTEALGLSTAEVEMLVSLNLEELLNGMPWLRSIRSTSVPGLSSVILTFQPGTDIMRARQLVQERLTAVYTLPNVSKPPAILQPLSATSRVMMVGLSSKAVSPIKMSVLARWNIRPALLGVPGVANVSIWGQRERQLQVQVDPKRLQRNGLSLDQIIRTAGDALWVSPLTFLNASTPGTGGWIDTPQQRLEVRHVLPISTPEDLAKVTVYDKKYDKKLSGGTPLRLGDVAEVVENHQPLIGDAVINDGPGLLLVVEKFPGANTLQVTRGVEARLAALRPGLPGIDIDTTIFRPATFIELAINNLTRSLLLGFLLVVLLLGVFLWDWRTALISVVAIPLSLVAAGLVLNARGATINMMVVAGLVIALGAVVDDAIVAVENVARRLRKAGNANATATTILEASLETHSAIFFATLILLLTVVPIFFLQGVSGSFFQPLALSYALAVLASLVVALTVTPALSLMLFSHAPREHRESPLMRWLHRGFDKMLTGIMRTPRLAYFAIGAPVLVALAVLPSLDQQSLLPTFRERDLMIQLEGAPGTSHPAMTRITTQISRELRAIPGVRNVAAHVGRAVLGDQVVGINSAELWIRIDPAVNYTATVAAMQKTVDGYPGFIRNVQTYLQKTQRQVLTGSSDTFVVRLYGPELDVLRSKAEEVRQALSGIGGVVDLHTELNIDAPQVEIKVDLAKAQRYGLKPGDVRRAAATLVNGLEVGSLFEEQKVFEVVVWSTPATRQSLTNIREFLIDTPSGGYVQLEDVADIRVASTLTTINREAVSRRSDVGFNVRGRDLGAVARDVERALEQVKFPLEYHSELLGEYEEREAARERILVAGIVALIGIFLLLQAAFQSWRLATLTFLTLPFALAGGVLATFFVSGGTISLGHLVGLLTILGIATRNSIMLINHYQHLEGQEGEPVGPGLVLRGTRERLAPILLTALTTGLAVVPFVLFGNIPGHEIAYPMAIMVLGGLVTSTVLNLFGLPALYLRFGVLGPNGTRKTTSLRTEEAPE